MKLEEIMILKRYAEGAYPSMKQDIGSDAVWADMLMPYDFQGMMASLKTHIRSGNRFAPSVAELIGGYETITANFDDEVLDKMVADGVFNDSASTDHEIDMWNRQNRVKKAKIWLSHPNRNLIMPSWFKSLYEAYKAQYTNLYFNKPQSAKQISLGGN